MQKLTNVLHRGNLTARERFLTLIKNDIHRTKTGKDILTEADKDALENWEAKDNYEAQEWNTLNEGWKLSGRMDLEVELLYKDTQVAYLSMLPFSLELLSYPLNQRIAGALKSLKTLKTVTIDEANKIVQKQRAVKLEDGIDFEYAVYQLAYELLTPEDQKRLKELYDDVPYDHQYLDQEEVIASLFDGKEELTQEAKKKLARMVADASYNSYATEYQFFHYFACIPVIEIAKYALKSRGIKLENPKDEDGLYESDLVKKAMEDYAAEHDTTIIEMLRKACLAALDSGLLDDYTPLVISDDAELFQRWLDSKKKAREVLKKHIADGELKIRNRNSSETHKDKLYSKKLYDGELELARELMENIGLETDVKGELDEKKNIGRFADVVITGESLYAFKGSYRFVQDFKERVNKYDPNLGLVYADDDPEQTGHHLDQELLICDFDKKGVLQIFSRYGMSTSLLSKAFDSKVYFKEVKEDSKTYLEFKNPIYEAAFRARRFDVMNGYAQLLAYEEVFKKLDVIYEANLSHHVLGRVKDAKEFIEYINQAVQIATNTQEDELKDKGNGPFRRKDQLHLREELLIDLNSLKPDTSLTEKHVEKLKGIFRNF